MTVENHSVIGGLAESVAATLAFTGVGTRLVPIALPDEFLAAGALPTLLGRYGLSTDARRRHGQDRARGRAGGARPWAADPAPATA
jgi:transketolase